MQGHGKEAAHDLLKLSQFVTTRSYPVCIVMLSHKKIRDFHIALSINLIGFYVV